MWCILFPVNTLFFITNRTEKHVKTVTQPTSHPFRQTRQCDLKTLGQNPFVDITVSKSLAQNRSKHNFYTNQSCPWPGGIWRTAPPPWSVAVSVITDDALQVGPVFYSSAPSGCLLVFVTVWAGVHSALIHRGWRVPPCWCSSSFRSTWAWNPDFIDGRS